MIDRILENQRVKLTSRANFQTNRIWQIQK